MAIRLGILTSTGTMTLAVLPIILGIQFLFQSLVIDIQIMPSKPLQNKTKLNRIFPEDLTSSKNDIEQA